MERKNSIRRIFAEFSCETSFLLCSAFQTESPRGALGDAGGSNRIVVAVCVWIAPSDQLSYLSADRKVGQPTPACASRRTRTSSGTTWGPPRPRRSFPSLWSLSRVRHETTLCDHRSSLRTSIIADRGRVRATSIGQREVSVSSGMTLDAGSNRTVGTDGSCKHEMRYGDSVALANAAGGKEEGLHDLGISPGDVRLEAISAKSSMRLSLRKAMGDTDTSFVLSGNEQEVDKMLDLDPDSSAARRTDREALGEMHDLSCDGIGSPTLRGFHTHEREVPGKSADFETGDVRVANSSEGLEPGDNPASSSTRWKPFGLALIGRRIRVWWDGENEWFPGVVRSYCPDRHKEEDGKILGPPTYRVAYDDGDECYEHLNSMAWEPIDEDAATEDAQARSTITSFTEKPAHGAKTANAVASVPARKRATGAFDVSGRDYAEVRNVGTDVYASEDIGVLDDIEEEAMEGLAPARYEPKRSRQRKPSMKMRRAVEDYTPDSDDNNFKSELLHIAKGLKDLRTHRLGKRRREAAITSAADGWRDNNDMEQTLDDGKSMGNMATVVVEMFKCTMIHGYFNRCKVSVKSDDGTWQGGRVCSSRKGDFRSVRLDNSQGIVTLQFYPPDLNKLNENGGYLIKGYEGIAQLSTGEDMWKHARAGQHVRVLYDDEIRGKEIRGKEIRGKYFLGVLGRFDETRRGWEAFFEDGEIAFLRVPDPDVMLVPVECSEALPLFVRSDRWWGHMYARLLRERRVQPKRLNLDEMERWARHESKTLSRGVRRKVSEGGGMRGTISGAGSGARSWGRGWASDTSDSETEWMPAKRSWRGRGRGRGCLNAAQRQLGGTKLQQLEALFDGRSLRAMAQSSRLKWRACAIAGRPCRKNGACSCSCAWQLLPAYQAEKSSHLPIDSMCLGDAPSISSERLYHMHMQGQPAPHLNGHQESTPAAEGNERGTVVAGLSTKVHDEDSRRTSDYERAKTLEISGLIENPSTFVRPNGDAIPGGGTEDTAVDLRNQNDDRFYVGELHDGEVKGRDEDAETLPKHSDRSCHLLDTVQPQTWEERVQVLRASYGSGGRMPAQGPGLNEGSIGYSGGISAAWLRCCGKQFLRRQDLEEHWHRHHSAGVVRVPLEDGGGYARNFGVLPLPPVPRAARVNAERGGIALVLPRETVEEAEERAALARRRAGGACGCVGFGQWTGAHRPERSGPPRTHLDIEAGLGRGGLGKGLLGRGTDLLNFATGLSGVGSGGAAGGGGGGIRTGTKLRESGRVQISRISREEADSVEDWSGEDEGAVADPHDVVLR